MRTFASDNTSGTHPLILQAVAEVNTDDVRPYGEDRWTAKATAELKEVFGDCIPYFVFTGTAANVLGLKCMLHSYEAVICAETAHINTSECGAPEAILGSKLVTVPSNGGKICLKDCKERFEKWGDVHHSFPKVISISQLTECGTVYTVEELKAISAFCRENNMYFHMDGTRISNAAAALQVSLKAITADVGVDVLSFGGTKNGLLFGEAVIFFNKELATSFPYYRKQYLQLGSKGRFIAAQFSAYMHNDLWRENALQANKSATLLANSIKDLPNVRLVHSVDGNMIFAEMQDATIAKLESSYYFYVFERTTQNNCPDGWHKVRLLTSFNTTQQTVTGFAEAIRLAGV